MGNVCSILSSSIRFIIYVALQDGAGTSSLIGHAFKIRSMVALVSSFLCISFLTIFTRNSMKPVNVKLVLIRSSFFKKMIRLFFIIAALLKWVHKTVSQAFFPDAEICST